MGELIMRGKAWKLGDDVDGDGGILALDVTMSVIGIRDERERRKVLKQNVELLPLGMQGEVDTIARYSFELRRDRELAFYGALDVDPWEDYTIDDANRALQMVDDILKWIHV